MNKKFLLILVVFITLCSLNVFAYCDGAYTSGNWTINSSINCSGIITVDGILSIVDDSEYGVTGFSEDENAVYDLRINSSMINNTIPNLIKNETNYTLDWDSELGQNFYIMMNESGHQVQIFINNTNHADWFYFIDWDNNESTGYGGNDIAVGYFTQLGYLGPILTCNGISTTIVNGADASPASSTCGNLDDPSFPFNYTIHFNETNLSSGNIWELVINSSGSWTDKDITATDTSDEFFTLFKNSPVVTDGVGNLTLNNVTINLQNNFTVESYLTIQNSNVTFLLTGNKSANFFADSDANLEINNSQFDSNDSGLYYGWRVTASGFNITFNNFSHSGGGGTSDYQYGNIYTSLSNGKISNNTFSNCMGAGISNACVQLYTGISNTNVTSNTFNGSFWCNGGAYDGNNFIIENNVILGEFVGPVLNSTVRNNTFNSSVNFGAISNGSVFENNIFNSNSLDTNSATATLLFSNSNGMINWSNKANFTIGTNFSIGNKIYLENNNIGIADDSNLVNLNTSAQITFYGLTGWGSNTPNVTKNGVNCTDCNIISWSNLNGTLVVNVASFSNYSAQNNGGSVFYCDGAYTSGNWTINSSLNCSDETINVNGTLNITGEYETNVTSFSADVRAAYDLRVYSSPNNFTLAIPNLVKNESFYSTDWNTKDNESFYISMNETQHAIQMFSNTSDFGDYVVEFDLDDNDDSGGNGGYDLIFGYWNTGGYTGAALACYNSTSDSFIPIVNGSLTDEGSETCGNVTGYDYDYDSTNFTVYWNYSNTTGSWEVLVVAQEAWEDINTWYYDNSTSKYTKFKASAVDTIGTAVNFNNVTLNLESNFTVDEGATLNLTDSTVNMNQTTNGSVKMLFEESSIINIDNCTFRSNNSELLWGLRVLTANYSIVNSNFTNNGLGSLDYAFNSYFDEDYGGTLYNNTFARLSSSKPANYRCFETAEKNNSGMNLSKNTFDCDVILFKGVGLNVEDNNFYQNFMIKQVNNSNFTNLNLNDGHFYIGEDYAAFYNTIWNLTNSYISDNGTGINTLIFSNDFGEIAWINKTDFTSAISLNLGTNIIIANNSIYLYEGHGTQNLRSTQARLTFNNLSRYNSQPYLYKDNVRCDTNSALCNITSWNSTEDKLIVSVSGFSNYTTSLEGPVISFTSSGRTVSPGVVLTFTCSASHPSNLSSIIVRVGGTTVCSGTSSCRGTYSAVSSSTASCSAVSTDGFSSETEITITVTTDGKGADDPPELSDYVEPGLKIRQVIRTTEGGKGKTIFIFDNATAVFTYRNNKPVIDLNMNLGELKGNYFRPENVFIPWFIYGIAIISFLVVLIFGSIGLDKATARYREMEDAYVNLVNTFNKDKISNFTRKVKKVKIETSYLNNVVTNLFKSKENKQEFKVPKGSIKEYKEELLNALGKLELSIEKEERKQVVIKIRALNRVHDSIRDQLSLSDNKKLDDRLDNLKNKLVSRK